MAYQVLHHSARVKAGDRVLIIGASGGIGTTFLQLGKLAGLKMYGLASADKHAILAEYGATPIDYRTQDFVEFIRRAEPGGLDAVFDGMCGDYFERGLSVLRRGGVYVEYGNPSACPPCCAFWARRSCITCCPMEGLPGCMARAPPAFRAASRTWKTWATLFKLLADGQIKPVIEGRYPILEAAQANTRPGKRPGGWQPGFAGARAAWSPDIINHLIRFHSIIR